MHWLYTVATGKLGQTQKVQKAPNPHFFYLLFYKFFKVKFHIYRTGPKYIPGEVLFWKSHIYICRSIALNLVLDAPAPFLLCEYVVHNGDEGEGAGDLQLEGTQLKVRVLWGAQFH